MLTATHTTHTHIRPPRIVNEETSLEEVIVTLPERLDVHQVESLHHQLRQLELGRGSRIAFDASVVEHTDLAGLELLVDAQAFCDGVGARLSLTNVSLALRLAIELTAVTGIPVERTDDLLADPFELVA